METTWYEMGIVNPDGSTQTVDIVDDRTEAMRRLLMATTGDNPTERIDFVDEWRNDKNGNPEISEGFDLKFWLLDAFLMHSYVFSDDDRDNVLTAIKGIEWVSEQ